MHCRTVRTSSSGITGLWSTQATLSASVRMDDPVTITMGIWRVMARAASFLLDRDAVEGPKHQVEHDQVGQAVLDDPQRVHAVARLVDVVAGQRERGPKHPPEIRVVLDDEHPLLPHLQQHSGIKYSPKLVCARDFLQARLDVVATTSVVLGPCHAAITGPA
jgi:hypothetical protein